jgi:hypothetical protein
MEDISSLSTESKQTSKKQRSKTAGGGVDEAKRSLRDRERGWILRSRVDEDHLKYDAILDPHCMYTKSSGFRRRLLRLLKDEFDVSVGHFDHDAHARASHRAPHRPWARLSIVSAHGGPFKPFTHESALGAYFDPPQERYKHQLEMDARRKLPKRVGYHTRKLLAEAEEERAMAGLMTASASSLTTRSALSNSGGDRAYGTA